MLNLFENILTFVLVCGVFGITVAMLNGYAKFIAFIEEHTVLGITIVALVSIAIGGVCGIQLFLITIGIVIIVKHFWKK